MFTSKGLFSSIPCPYNSSCTLPKCLFLHSKSTTKNASSSRETQIIVESNVRIPDNVQRSRKDDTASACLKTKPDNAPQLKTALRTVHRHVSPPPLRRTPDSASSKAKVEPKTTAEPVKRDMPTETPPAKRQKVEVLNPRMLKSAPASHDLRHRLLKALHGEFVRLNNELRRDAGDSQKELVFSDQALIKMALDVEEAAAIDKPSIYSNVVKNKILVYKRMSVQNWKDERATELSRQEALKAMSASDPVSSAPPKPIVTGLSRVEELAFLSRLYTSIEGLAKHGYVPSVPMEEEIKQAQKGVEAAKGWEVCDRCKSRFQVFPGRREEDGALVSGGLCKYHWGRAYLQDKSVSDPKAKRERKYKCCGECIGDSTGCTQANSHVFKVSEVKRLAALLNFEETPENETGSKTPVCIDGEMGYTVHGLELIRLTATSWPDGEELLDVLVRPIGEVLDLNSRFSGIWPQQMADAVPWTPNQDDTALDKPSPNGKDQKELCIVTSPAEARSLLFKHLSPKTPLIGHGLENDLNAVRIVHPTIIDTALLFPHRAGLPYRNGLKALMFTHLQRHIQVVSDDEIRGHDSKEDARAAGDLVRYKIGTEWQKMKGEGWSLENGEFIPPRGSGNGLQAILTGPRSMLTVDFLERGQPAPDTIMSLSKAESGTRTGTKRSLAEISRDDIEDGEVGE